MAPHTSNTASRTADPRAQAPATPVRSSATPPPPVHQPVQTAADKKRKECESALNSLKVVKKPRVKRPRQAKEKTVEQQLVEGAKYFKRCIDPFLPLFNVYVEGVRAEQQDEYADDWADFIVELPNLEATPAADPNADQNMEPSEPTPSDATPLIQPENTEKTTPGTQDYLTHCLDCWEKLKAHSPVFLIFAEFCVVHQDPEEFLKIASKLWEVANQVQYDDNHTLKRELHKLVSPNIFTGTSCVQNFSSKGPKTERGMRNDVILELMLDWDDIVEYRDGNDAERSEILDAYRTSKKELDAGGLPALLYDVFFVEEPALDEDGEPIKRFEDGFLLSPLLANVARTIFMSGRIGNKNKHVDVARSMDMRVFTPESKVYVAMMLRYAMSTVDSWGEDDNDFSFQEFYYGTLDFYRTLDAIQQDQIMQFWNIEVFGDAKGRVEKSLRDKKPKDGSNLNQYHQRREKEAAAAKAAAEKAAAEKAAAEKAAAEKAAEEAAGATGHGEEQNGDGDGN
ncbi:hypothetical protein PM082_023754 [Marasmius tenuissimus]|nr:hypothetical protein PM082_023754 [Marasmius tenuissimus]